MKKSAFSGKLNLKKETVSELNNRELGAIKGGDIVRQTYIVCPSVLVQCQTKSCNFSICIPIGRN